MKRTFVQKFAMTASVAALALGGAACAAEDDGGLDPAQEDPTLDDGATLDDGTGGDTGATGDAGTGDDATGGDTGTMDDTGGTDDGGAGVGEVDTGDDADM